MWPPADRSFAGTCRTRAPRDSDTRTLAWFRVTSNGSTDRGAPSRSAAVDAPLGTQRIADLAERGASLDRRDDRRHQIVRASRRRADPVQRVLHSSSIPLPTEGLELRLLRRLERRIVRLLDRLGATIDLERVHADDHLLAALHGELVRVGGAVDLLLEEG